MFSTFHVSKHFCLLQIKNGDLGECYVKSCRIRTCRNLRGLSLMPHMCRAERREVERTVQTALKGMCGAFKGEYFPLKGMKSEMKKQLSEVHVLNHINFIIT